MHTATEVNSSPRTPVSCSVCLKEIPLSEVNSQEATDYVQHFCGLECYQTWKTQQALEDD